MGEGTDLEFALFYFQFQGRKPEQDLMDIICVFSKPGLGGLICIWEPQKHAF